MNDSQSIPSDADGQHEDSYRNVESTCGTEQYTRKCLNFIPGKKGQRMHVTCSVCSEFPEAVRQFHPKRNLPPMCTAEGAEARSYTINTHLKSAYHRECLRLQRFSKLTDEKKLEETPVLKSISAQNKQLADKIGGLIFQVYNDAKSLSLSAYSWPSRIVAGELASRFDYNKPFENYTASSFDMQYIHPGFHRELLTSIVQSHLSTFRAEIQQCLAASFRCDASMDRMQVDSEFELLKIINSDGSESLKYIGVGQVTEPGAQGHFSAIKRAADDTVGFSEVLKVVSHISTDGENKNVGQHHGLWRLLDDEKKRVQNNNVPLLKSVCAVHSSALAFKDVCKNVPEVRFVIGELSSLSTYFHTSARRTSDLQEVADENNLNVYRFPQYFEVRWAEFSGRLLAAVLGSWRALIAFGLPRKSETEASRFTKYLKNYDNLKLMCFICDLLFVLANLQRKLQSDSLTILSSRTVKVPAKG